MNERIDGHMSRLADITPLIAQMLEWLEPGDYRFSERYPEQAATWVEVSSNLEAEDVRAARVVGYHMRKLVQAINQADEEVKQGRSIAKQAAKVLSALNKFVRAFERYREKVLRCHLT